MKVLIAFLTTTLLLQICVTLNQDTDDIDNVITSFLDPITSGIGSFSTRHFSHHYGVRGSRKRRGSGGNTDTGKVSVEYEMYSGPCRSKIYCGGELLETIQKSGLFPDSKSFVDMPTKRPEADVINAFDAISNKTDRGALEQFIADNFHPAGFEIHAFDPTDWKQNPSFLAGISDPRIVSFGLAVHEKWKALTRVFRKEGLCKGCVVSSLHAPYPFVVPGGRFREFYYWDSFWIVKGLLLSEMYETVHGHLMNMLEAIRVFGFLPNGFRVYYLNRSQPPLLAQMISMYLDHCNNETFLDLALPLLDREYAFWMTQRAVLIPDNDRNHTLNVYRVCNDAPRPESFIEDLEAASRSKREKSYYANIASGAESGWDFTSRWLRNGSDLDSIDIWNIVPVDLNSMLYENEKILANLHARKGNREKARFYEKARLDRIDAIHSILWNEKARCWLDHNITSGTFTGVDFHASNLSPLWFGAYDSDIVTPSVVDEILERAHSPLISYPGGTPTSLTHSLQQWDFPNSWAPIEYYVDKMYTDILLADSNNERRYQKSGSSIRKAQALSVRRWIWTTYCGWKLNGTFYEKYDVRKIGSSGYGGEYKPQDGFGWTNGVILHMLKKHGSWLTAPSNCTSFMLQNEADLISDDNDDVQEDDEDNSENGSSSFKTMIIIFPLALVMLVLIAALPIFLNRRKQVNHVPVAHV